MMIYPIKWLPYLIIIGGILVIIFEGDVVWGLCLIGIGVAGLYIKKKFFDSNSYAQNTQNINTQTTNTQATNFQNTNMNYNGTTTTASNFCGKCGSKVQPGDLFCENCGNKLNG